MKTDKQETTATTAGPATKLVVGYVQHPGRVPVNQSFTATSAGTVLDANGNTVSEGAINWSVVPFSVRATNHRNCLVEGTVGSRVGEQYNITLTGTYSLNPSISGRQSFTITVIEG